MENSPTLQSIALAVTPNLYSEVVMTWDMKKPELVGDRDAWISQVHTLFNTEVMQVDDGLQGVRGLESLKRPYRPHMMVLHHALKQEWSKWAECNGYVLHAYEGNPGGVVLVDAREHSDDAYPNSLSPLHVKTYIEQALGSVRWEETQVPAKAIGIAQAVKTVKDRQYKLLNIFNDERIKNRFDRRYGNALNALATGASVFLGLTMMGFLGFPLLSVVVPWLAGFAVAGLCVTVGFGVAVDRKSRKMGNQIRALRVEAGLEPKDGARHSDQRGALHKSLSYPPRSAGSLRAGVDEGSAMDRGAVEMSALLTREEDGAKHGRKR